MKALSIRAPWWWWILYGGKDIENRTRRTHYRGPILLHASSWWSLPQVRADNNAATDMARHNGKAFQLLHESDFNHVRALGGHIVAAAEIVDCLEPTLYGNAASSPWHMPGQYGWKLANVRPVNNPMPCKGALGLFETGMRVEGKTLFSKEL